MDEFLLEDERIDDLERDGYRIIQKTGGFRFGMDAVLLSGFVPPSSSGKIIDLGTGTGIIPILLRAKTASRDLTGLEILEEYCSMANRSVRMNGIEGEVRIVRGDIRQASDILGKGCFDIVTANPPYMKEGGGLKKADEKAALARHEVLCTFRDVAQSAAALLKENGKFYLVHRPERLAEIMDTLRSVRLEPKRLRLVHSFASQGASLFLLEASLGGRSGMKVEKPLIVYRERGVYSDEILDIYGFSREKT